MVRDFFARRPVLVDGTSTTYALHVPSGTPAGERLPVILFLHGAGESGSDGILPTTVGLGPAVERDPAQWPALIVFPQASRGYGWRGFNIAAAFAALNDVERHYTVDPDRVYVTGISMGGYGTWLAALLQPRRFAAIAPVCGGLDAAAAIHAGALDHGAAHDRAALTIGAIPQWVFHGDADDVIPVEESRAMVAALRAANAGVRYTEYAGVRHNSWDRAYAEPDLAPWMFSCRR